MALDREKVVRAALRLLNKVGLEGLTLRRLASELHVKAPALYWHFKNKQELLDEMATFVLVNSAGRTLPSDQGAWREWVMHFGKAIRDMLLRYRDGAKMISGTYLTDNTFFASMENAMRRLMDAGFSAHDAGTALHTIYCYAVGFTIEEQAVFPRPGKRDPRYDRTTRAQRIDRERFPLAVAAGEQMYEFDKRFERGMEIIIRGLRP
jgi:TetR/AcrR family tetracycline transcriptional repressor